MRLPPWMWRVIRSRKTKIFLACAPFAFCLLVLLFYFGTSWWGRSRVERQLRDFESAGYVVDPEKYWLPSIPAQDDLFQDPLFQEEQRDRVLLPLNPGHTKIPNLAKRLPKAEPSLARMTELSRWLNPPMPDDRTAAELLLKEHHAAVERLEVLRPVFARSKQAVWPVEMAGNDFGGGPELASVAGPMIRLRHSAQAAGEIAVLHFAAGDADKSAAAVAAMLDIVRLEMEPKPALVSVILADVLLRNIQAVIWEGVVRGSWSDAHLQAFDKSLASFRPQQAGLKSHLGEIALLRSQTKWLLASRRALPEIEIDWPAGSRKWEPSAIWDATKEAAGQLRSPGLELAGGVKSQREFLDAVPRADGAPRERFTAQNLDEFRRIDETSGRTSLEFTGGAQALVILASSTLRMETTIALTRTGIALERYRVGKGNGTYPDSLAALVPDFLPEVPMDPLGTQPLHYQLQADGSPHLWSVGGNFTDDGGKPHFDFTEGDLIWITRPLPGFTTEKDLRR